MMSPVKLIDYKAVLIWVMVFALPTSTALGQGFRFHNRSRHYQYQHDPHCLPPTHIHPPIQTEPPIMPKITDPKDKKTPTPPPVTEPATSDIDFAGLTAPGISPGFGGAMLGQTASAPGYLDSALPLTQIRLRYDSAYNNNRPDRAEFFYAKCGCFRIAQIDPDADGPPLEETGVDYQDITTYLEYAWTNRFSTFVDVPVRFLNPDRNDNTVGLANMNFGGKYALLYCPDSVLSFQLAMAAPTGDADRGLGNDLFSFSPSLLYYERLTDRLQFDGQVGIWIPAGGSDFAGNIVNYGFGLTWFAVDNCNYRIAPVAEVLGWTVLDGQEFAFPPGVIDNAGGDTIVNAKIGVRVFFGPRDMVGGRSDVYFGYGRALTGEVWYSDILRLEYRMRF